MQSKYYLHYIISFYSIHPYKYLGSITQMEEKKPPIHFEKHLVTITPKPDASKTFYWYMAKGVPLDNFIEYYLKYDMARLADMFNFSFDATAPFTVEEANKSKYSVSIAQPTD